MGRKPVDPVARFWAKVDKSGECWIWTGYCDPRGYGRFSLNNTPEYAHRIAWELLHGPIPAGKEVCHNCPYGDNPACVRHLWLGSHTENIYDRGAKGRTAHGTQLRRKLSPDAVRSIRLRLANGCTGESLAQEYGVHAVTITAIRHHRTWKHI